MIQSDAFEKVASCHFSVGKVATFFINNETEAYIKKKIIVLISIVLFALVFVTTVVYAYYKIVKEAPGSSISISNIQFKLNGESSVNNTHVFSGTKQSIGDGYLLDLNLSISGTMTSSYASKYSISFEYVSENGIKDNELSEAIEVYELTEDGYQYVCRLSEFVKENAITGYLGINESKNHRYKLVYSAGASSYYNNKTFNIRCSATSTIESTTAEEFPNYYLTSTVDFTADAIFEKISQQASTIEGKNICLLQNVTIGGNSPIIFNNLVGLDLNGKTLSLQNDLTLIANSANDYPNCLLHDSKLSEYADSVDENNHPISHIASTNNSKIRIITDSTILPIDKAFYEKYKDFIEITYRSKTFSVLSTKITNLLNAYSYFSLSASTQKEIDGVMESCVEFDVLQNYYPYFDKIASLSMEDIVLDGESSLPTDGKGVFFLPAREYTTTISVDFSLVAYEDHLEIRTPLKVIGTSTNSIGEELLDKLPEFIEGSLYLPSYLPFENAYLTWVSENENLLSSQGVLLPNGLATLDSFCNQTIKLGVIVEVNNIRTSVYKEYEIQVLSISEKTELLSYYQQFNFDHAPTVGEDDGDKVIYTLDNILMQKHGLSYEELADYLLQNYGVNTTKELAKKMGLLSISIDGVDNSQYNTNSVYVTKTDLGTIEEDGYTYFRLSMVEKPTSGTVSYPVTIRYQYSIKDEQAEEYSITKSLTILSYSQTQEAIDLTPDLMAPLEDYDSYNSKILSTDSQLRNRYNVYKDAFYLRKTVTKLNQTFSVTYSVPEEYKDYVYLDYSTDTEGRFNENNTESCPQIRIRISQVPAITSKITINADVGTVHYQLSFSCIGVYHNITEEIPDSNFYFSLLRECDTNNDGWLTVLEAKNNISSIDFSKRDI